MSKWNRKTILRTFLFFLLLSMVITNLYYCTQTDTVSSPPHNGEPYLQVMVKDKQYPIEDVTINLSLGTFELFDSQTDRKAHYGNDAFLGIVLYFCSWKDYEKDLSSVSFDDLTCVEEFDFIKFIPAEEALSSQYWVFVGPFYNITFAHKEKLTIPEEIIEKYADEGAIMLQAIAIASKGGAVNATYISYVRIPYKIINGKQVEFTF